MKNNIKEWACSLSGCDGGNIQADTWLCGIEWGGGSRDNYYEIGLPQEINNGAASTNLKKHDWKNSISYTYGRSFAKLYKAIAGGKVEDYKEVVNLTGSELFKTNLYPIAFDSTDHSLWHKNGLDNLTGFESKHLFNTWCFFNRFPEFSKLRKKHKPKLIICTGVDYLRDYLMFFGGNGNIDKLKTDIVAPQSKANAYDRTYYWVHLDNDSLLVVIPFFSDRYGLNSNHLLQEMGSKVRELLKLRGFCLPQ